MKIAFTGAGGGHFYPLIAVAESVRKQVFIQKLNTPEMFFFSDAPYDERALFDNEIRFVYVPSGKLHVFPSLENVINVCKTFWGIFVALRKLYSIFPDVIFAKGGYASFPVLFAARILSIPVIVHESDTVAGRVTQWAGKFAERVAISQKEAQVYFTNQQTALTGLPIREKLLPPLHYVRNFPEHRRPVLLVFCGSQGSLKINEAVLSALPELMETYDVVHQTGPLNFETVKAISQKVLANNSHKDRYYVDGFIDPGIFYPKVDCVVTRGGSTTLIETALWKLPQIIIPIPESVSRDQRTNAYTFAKLGTATVIEENNLTPHLLVSEINRICGDREIFERMSKAGEALAYTRGASDIIATEMLRIALSHYA